MPFPLSHCKHGLPHHITITKEFEDILYEHCEVCDRKFRWNKGEGGRIHNRKYLKAHSGDFCQPFGRTKKLFYKLYGPPVDPKINKYATPRTKSVWEEYEETKKNPSKWD